MSNQLMITLQAARDGLAVIEYGQDSKAVSEMHQLYEEIYGD